jgi:hypothetical protein
MNINNKKPNSIFLFTLVILLLCMTVLAILFAVKIKGLNELLDLDKENMVHKSLVVFDMLPNNIKKQYKLKDTSALVDEDSLLTINDSFSSNEKMKVRYKGDKRLILISQVECFDMEYGLYEVPSSCTYKISKFFQNVNKKMVFEVVPKVQHRDLLDVGKIANMLNQEEMTKYDINKRSLGNFTQYTRDGLAHNRSYQGILLLINKYGSDIVVLSTIMHKFSSDKSGFIIKAYNEF